MQVAPDLSSFQERIENCYPVRLKGRVIRVTGLIIESVGPLASIGEQCLIHTSHAKGIIKSEVVGFKHGNCRFLVCFW